MNAPANLTETILRIIFGAGGLLLFFYLLSMVIDWLTGSSNPPFSDYRHDGLNFSSSSTSELGGGVEYWTKQIADLMEKQNHDYARQHNVSIEVARRIMRRQEDESWLSAAAGRSPFGDPKGWIHNPYNIGNHDNHRSY